MINYVLIALVSVIVLMGIYSKIVTTENRKLLQDIATLKSQTRELASTIATKDKDIQTANDSIDEAKKFADERERKAVEAQHNANLLAKQNEKLAGELLLAKPKSTNTCISGSEEDKLFNEYIDKRNTIIVH